MAKETCTLAFRATKKFRHAIEHAASRRMLSKSDYVRLATMRALQEEGCAPTETE
jgi:hypothetical protein